MRCRITNEKCKIFLDLGKMPLSNGFLKKKDFKKEFFFEMEVGFSKDVSLFQLNEHPKPTLMFNKNLFVLFSINLKIKHAAVNILSIFYKYLCSTHVLGRCI